MDSPEGKILACPNLKISNPHLNADGTIEGEKVYMKFVEKGHVQWVKKQDAYGGNTFSSFFPANLSQRQLLQVISIHLSKHKEVILRNLQQDKLTSFCFREKNSQNNQKFNVVTVLGLSQPGQVEVVTAYPVKHCKASSIILGGS